MARPKFKSPAKVKASGIKIPKKYTNKDKSQAKRMADEIKKFKGSKKGQGKSPYGFLWSGDTDSKTGRAYKTKKSAATKTMNKIMKKKK